MNPKQFIVTEKAQRLAKMDGTCFYCSQPIGDFHKDNCVLIRKKVKVRCIIDYPITVPSYWDSHDVEFHRNEGGWCADNIIDELETLSESNCLCDITQYEYIEDITGAELDES